MEKFFCCNWKEYYLNLLHSMFILVSVDEQAGLKSYLVTNPEVGSSRVETHIKRGTLQETVPLALATRQRHTNLFSV